MVMLEFGDGKILVSHAVNRDGLSLVVLETNQGQAPVGSIAPDVPRKLGDVISQEEIDAADCVLTFKNVEGVAVLMNALMGAMLQQLGLPPESEQTNENSNDHPRH